MSDKENNFPNNNSRNLNYEEPRTETQKDMIQETGDKNNVQVITTKKEEKYGETPYRWFFLVSYCLMCFVNQAQWVCFSAILTDFSNHYDKPQWKVNMFSLIYMIIYVITCFPEAYIIDTYNLRIFLIITAACNIVGAGLKLLINKDSSLASCYIGQIIASLFQPILLNTPGKIAANWFREDIRTVICTICCLSVIFGALVGFLWNLMFIENNMETEKFKDKVFEYLLSEFILTFVFCVPTFFITKDKPEIPTSPSQEETQKPPGFKESLKLLISNKRFIYLFISYLLVVGYYDIMSTIINGLLDLYTITGTQSSVIYAVGNVIGTIASLVISWILDKTKKFKLIMIILAVSGTIFQGLFTLLLELVEKKDLNAYAIGIIMYSLINISIISFYSIGMNYACEITYPVGEAINGSIMTSTPQLLAIALTFLCDHFINKKADKKWASNIILIILLAFSVVFVCLLDEKLDRQEVEKSGRLKEKKENDEINKGSTDVVNVKNDENKS